MAGYSVTISRCVNCCKCVGKYQFFRCVKSFGSVCVLVKVCKRMVNSNMSQTQISDAMQFDANHMYIDDTFQ